MLTFPVSAIGWVASMVQRASASQKRLNEFLETEPAVKDVNNAVKPDVTGNIAFNNVDFTYAHTGINALKKFSLKIPAGHKIVIKGKTGSGKSTIALNLANQLMEGWTIFYIEGIDPNLSPYLTCHIGTKLYSKKKLKLGSDISFGISFLPVPISLEFGT